jgi:hypothetical protein
MNNSPIKNSFDNRYSNSNNLEVVDIDSKSLANIWEIYERLRRESIGNAIDKDTKTDLSRSSSSPNNNLKSYYALEKKLSLISIIKIRLANIIDLDYFSISLYPSLQELYFDSIPPSTVSDLFQFRDQLKVLEFVNSGIPDIYSALAKDVDFDKLKHFKPLVILNETRTVPSNTIQWLSLHTLTLSNCGINKLDQSMHLFPSITELDLSKNDIVHVVHLQDCYCLSVLNLSHNRIRVLSNLGQSLGKVTRLNLCNNEIESLDGISFIYSLERLDVSFNYINDFTEIQYLSKLPCLEIIVLEGNPIAEHINYRLLVYKEFLNDGSILSSNRQLPAIDGLNMSKKEKKALRGIMFRAPKNIQRESTKKKDDFFQSEQQGSGYSPLLHYRLSTAGNQLTSTSLEDAFNRSFSGDIGRAKARYNFEAKSDKSPLSTPTRSSGQSTPRSSPNHAIYSPNNLISSDYPSVFPSLDIVGPLGNKVLPRKMPESEILVGFKSQINYDYTSKTNSLIASTLMNEDGIEVKVTDIISRCNATLRNRKRRVASIMDTELVTEAVDLNYIKQICKEKHLLEKEEKRKKLLVELEEKMEREREKEMFLAASRLNVKTSTTSPLSSAPFTAPTYNSNILNSNDTNELFNREGNIDYNNNVYINSNLAIDLNKNNEASNSDITSYDTTASILSELRRDDDNIIVTTNDDSSNILQPSTSTKTPLIPSQDIMSMDEILIPLERRITQESSNLNINEEIISNIINNTTTNEIKDGNIYNRTNSTDSDASDENSDIISFSEFNGNREEINNIDINPVLVAPKSVHIDLNDSLLTSEFDKISISNLIKDKQLKQDLVDNTTESRERISSSAETSRWPSLTNKYASDKQVYIGNVEYLQLSILENFELYCREQIFSLSRPSGDSPYIQTEPKNLTDENVPWDVEFIEPPFLTERFVCVYCESIIELSPGNQLVVNKSNPPSPQKSNPLSTITVETMITETKALLILTDCNLYVVKYDSINPSETFCDAPIPTLIFSYHLYTLNICTIFFGFQRCVLGFCESKSRSKYSNNNSNSPVKFQSSSNPNTPVSSLSPAPDQSQSHLLM